MEAVISDLKHNLNVEIVRPGDANYDEERTVYNAMIDKRPALIAKCKSTADVIEAILYARDENIEVSIRSGGHSGPGHALVDDGLVIDLSPMKNIHVDPKRRTAKVEPGCTWGEVDSATHEYGLATVSGIISTTGVGGLTLGGGHGYLSRKYGLTIDNLISAEVVLADGKLVKASEKENADLFWALRGGGGNFGFVTSFEFRLHPVKNVMAGPLFWPIDQLETTMKWYWKGDFVSEISDEAIEEHLRFATIPTPLSTMHLYPVDGAVHDVGKDETAWGKRDARWSMVIVGVDPDPKNTEKIKTWARDYWEAVHPHTLGGSYINFMMEEGQDRVEASYGDNYRRLQKVKAKYDPDNFFHVNQNIKPTN